MKRHETKMARMEDILNLPLQDPPCAEFSAADLKWVKVQGGRQGGDDIALIPYARVDDFVKGESTNAECPANFRVESRRKRREGSISKPRVDGYLEYTLYWCSYGREDYRDSNTGIHDGSSVKPATGKGSRPGRRHMMRGCLCHFTIKRPYTRPLIALIIYNQKNHVDKNGSPCHGMLDCQALGTRAMYAPRISEHLRLKVMAMLYVGLSVEKIMKHHVEVVERHGGPHNRDDLLTRSDVRNMERLVRGSEYELNENDECSLKLWVGRHKKHVFFFRDFEESEPFILGIQTDWQLQQMIRYGHNAYIATHSSFGVNKLKHPLCTLLAFDSSRTAIPVAWIISSSSVGQIAHKWIRPLAERIQIKDPKWQLNSFLVDDPSFDITALRSAFQCSRVQLCLWRVRRSWIRNVIKRCCIFDVQQDMLKHLASIFYRTRNSPNPMNEVEEFMQVFVDQHEFIGYFKRRWLPGIESWIKCVRTLPLAGPEIQAAVESYHLHSKSKLLEEQNSRFWPRIDWLVHTLTTVYHSLFFLDQSSLLKDHTLSGNAWSHAMNIPDADVILDENIHTAKVVSQADKDITYTIWNPGSEFCLCECNWSRMGNLCKHVIKVAVLCKNREMSTRSFTNQDYPVVLDHAIVHEVRLQQEIRSLEHLSSVRMLEHLPSEMNLSLEDNAQNFRDSIT